MLFIESEPVIHAFWVCPNAAKFRDLKPQVEV